MCNNERLANNVISPTVNQFGCGTVFASVWCSPVAVSLMKSYRPVPYYIGLQRVSTVLYYVIEI